MIVDKDLAVLLMAARYYDGAAHDPVARAAHERVQAELSRLREQRDAAERWDERTRAAWDEEVGKRVAAEARCARLQQALAEMEKSALKAAQLLPMTVSTSVESDHRDDHASWAGWLLRHKVLPAAREALAGPDTPADKTKRCPGCGGDAGDNHFDLSLCHCGDGAGTIHTYCNACGYALDGCDFQPDLRPAVSQEDKT